MTAHCSTPSRTAADTTGQLSFSIDIIQHNKPAVSRLLDLEYMKCVLPRQACIYLPEGSSLRRDSSRPAKTGACRETRTMCW